MPSIEEIYLNIVCGDEINWDKVSLDEGLSEEFIIEFRDRLNWHNVCLRENLSERFIHKFSNYVYWPLICSGLNKLSEGFIREHKQYFDFYSWLFVYAYQNLSREFYLENSEYLRNIVNISKFNEEDIEFQKIFLDKII